MPQHCAPMPQHSVPVCGPAPPQKTVAGHIVRAQAQANVALSKVAQPRPSAAAAVNTCGGARGRHTCTGSTALAKRSGRAARACGGTRVRPRPRRKILPRGKSVARKPAAVDSGAGILKDETRGNGAMEWPSARTWRRMGGRPATAPASHPAARSRACAHRQAKGSSRVGATRCGKQQRPASHVKPGVRVRSPTGGCARCRYL